MGRDYWKSFYNWLETASPDEIRERRDVGIEQLSSASDRFVRSEIRRMIRECDAELLSRAELEALRRTKR